MGNIMKRNKINRINVANITISGLSDTPNHAEKQFNDVIIPFF
jgi:hypothetical protein